MHAILGAMTTQEISEKLSDFVSTAVARVSITRQVLPPKEYGNLAAEAVTSFLEMLRIVMVQLPEPQPTRDGVGTMFGDFTVWPNGGVTFRDDMLKQDLDALQWQAQCRMAAIESARAILASMPENN